MIKMGDIVEDFLQCLYDIPVEIDKKYPNAKVTSYKKTKEGDFDDWDMGVAGMYDIYIESNNKIVAIVHDKITVQDKYDDEDKAINDFNSPTDAIVIKTVNIDYI